MLLALRDNSTKDVMLEQALPDLPHQVEQAQSSDRDGAGVTSTTAERCKVPFPPTS